MITPRGRAGTLLNKQGWFLLRPIFGCWVTYVQKIFNPFEKHVHLLVKAETLIMTFFLDRALQPFLQQIDHLEEGVQKLEAAAYQLDTYSKQLGE